MLYPVLIDYAYCFSLGASVFSLRELKNKIELSSFFEKVKIFFKKNGLLLNWNEFNKLSLEQQINTLAMISPISNEEKQKLLETVGINEIRETLSKIIEFYIYNKDPNNMTVQ